MPVQPRNLLLFLALAAAAIVTWMLARNSQQESNASGNDARQAPQGYYMRGVVSSSTNGDGEVEFRFNAEKLEQESGGSDYGLEEVRVEYSETSDVAWLLTAARGTMSADRERLALQSVRLRAQTNSQGNDGPQTFVFETSDLDLDVRARIASTEQPVGMRKGQCESNARGLIVDLNKDTIEFPESETSCWRRASSSTAPALVLALVAGSAIAQDDATGRTTNLCYPGTGNLVTNEYTCKDAVITDNETFRITAGLAVVKDQRGMVFEQVEWRLTEGVRLEFETAVMVAESASMIWDGDGVLRSFDLVGTPSEFSDIIEGRTNPVRVTAPRIVYDREAGTLKMPGTFELLEDGAEGNWGSGCDLTYWLAEKRWLMGTPRCPSVLSLAPTEAKDSGDTPPDEP